MFLLLVCSFAIFGVFLCLLSSICFFLEINRIQILAGRTRTHVIRAGITAVMRLPAATPIAPDVSHGRVDLIVLIVSQVRIVVVVVLMMILSTPRAGSLFASSIRRAGDIVVQHLRLLGAQSQRESEILRQLVHDLARSDQPPKALLRKGEKGR